MAYKYSVEMFYPDKGWVEEIRIYNVFKSAFEFDSKDIPNKRRNFKFLGKCAYTELPFEK